VDATRLTSARLAVNDAQVKLRIALPILPDDAYSAVGAVVAVDNRLHVRVVTFTDGLECALDSQLLVVGRDDYTDERQSAGALLSGKLVAAVYLPNVIQVGADNVQAKVNSVDQSKNH